MTVEFSVTVNLVFFLSVSLFLGIRQELTANINENNKKGIKSPEDCCKVIYHILENKTKQSEIYSPQNFDFLVQNEKLL